MDLIGHISAIGSFVLAVLASGYALWEYLARKRLYRKKRHRLETYLEEAWQQRGSGQGLRTMLHLKKELCLTETEITNIVFESSALRFFSETDGDGKTSDLLVGDIRAGK